MDIYEEIIKLLDLIDGEKYPETKDFIQHLVNSGDAAVIPGMELAAALKDCDSQLPISEDVFTLITGIYEEEIEKGNSDAMNDMGALYYTGRGCKQDFEKAVKYYTMAADLGNRQATENLGYCYYYGRTGKVDYEKAYHCFVKGALDGHIISLYKIGDMYKNGYYVKKDLNEAFAIYMRCIDTMTDEAAPACAGPVYLRLGEMLLNGWGCKKDPKAALITYQHAERYLFDMVNNGDYFYQKSLIAAMQGQNAARMALYPDLPDLSWSLNNDK